MDKSHERARHLGRVLMFNDVPQYTALADTAWEASSERQKNKRTKTNLKQICKSHIVEIITLV